VHLLQMQPDNPEVTAVLDFLGERFRH
jgi:hypothetical protein